MANDLNKYRALLTELVARLQEAPRSADELAELFGCTKQSIYNRVRDLVKIGASVTESSRPGKGGRGRPCKVWSIEASDGQA